MFKKIILLIAVVILATFSVRVFKNSTATTTTLAPVTVTYQSLLAYPSDSGQDNWFDFTLPSDFSTLDYAQLSASYTTRNQVDSTTLEMAVVHYSSTDPSYVNVPPSTDNTLVQILVTPSGFPGTKKRDSEETTTDIKLRANDKCSFYTRITNTTLRIDNIVYTFTLKYYPLQTPQTTTTTTVTNGNTTTTNNGTTPTTSTTTTKKTYPVLPRGPIDLSQYPSADAQDLSTNSIQYFDRDSVWITAFENVVCNGPVQKTATTARSVQLNDGVTCMNYNSSTGVYSGVGNQMSFSQNTTSSLSSGNIIAGRPSQCVGIVDQQTRICFITPYGFTSISPPAYNGANAQYDLPAGDTLTNIAKFIPAAYPVAFLYDATASTYGTVYLLSQI